MIALLFHALIDFDAQWGVRADRWRSYSNELMRLRSVIPQS